MALKLLYAKRFLIIDQSYILQGCEVQFLFYLYSNYHDYFFNFQDLTDSKSVTESLCVVTKSTTHLADVFTEKHMGRCSQTMVNTC